MKKSTFPPFARYGSNPVSQDAYVSPCVRACPNIHTAHLKVGGFVNEFKVGSGVVNLVLSLLKFLCIFLVLPTAQKERDLAL
mmetsp:Transcript_4287/g.5026  ORF Transcript_4287/g.5026 Transcript_4287/m.5026 type:complete len:82 (-) Transcript_4287:585-830(-)